MWKTFATRDGIVFASLARIFRFGARVEVWKPQNAFHIAFQAGERIFVREPGRGLLELQEGVWRLVPGGERFAQERAYVLPGDGPGSVLIGTRTMGMFELAGGALRPLVTEVDAELKRDLLTTVLRLADGSLALGKGMARAELGAPVSSFKEGGGLDAMALAIHRHAGTLFVGTNHGAFRLVTGAKSNARFVPIPEIKDQTHAFLTVGASLLVANNLGVYEVRGGSARLVRPSPNPTTDLLPSKLEPSRVLVGLANGMASLRWTGGRWVDEGKVPGLTETVLSLQEAADGRVWVGTYGQGLLRVTLPAGWKGGAALPGPVVERFGTAQGLPGPMGNTVHLLDGRPVFSTGKGLYLFDDASGRFVPEPRTQALAQDGSWGVGAVARDAKGWLWMSIADSSHSETGAALPQADGSLRWDPMPLRGQVEAACIYPERDGIVWFGGATGLFRYDRKVAEGLVQPFEPLIRRVTTHGDKGLFGGQGHPGPPSLAYRDNALRFEFASPYFPALGGITYQVLLEGVDVAWSPWSSEAYRDCSSLREGAYRFRVRARGPLGIAGKEAIYTFRITPPWYRTWWAFAVYLLAGGLGVHGLVRLSRRAFELENQRLEARVTERTEALARKTETLECLAALATDLQKATTLADFSGAALGQMARWLKVHFGALYVLDEGGALLVPGGALGILVATLSPLALGQDLVGQCGLERSPIVLTQPEGSAFRIVSGIGVITPRWIRMEPVLQQGRLLGVLVLGSVNTPDARQLALLEAMVPMVAMSLEILKPNLAARSLAAELQGLRAHIQETKGPTS